MVIYSHGWTGFRGIAVNQIETLVSHGYMVIAPDHTYGASVTTFADGEVVPYFPGALPEEDDVEAETYANASQTLLEVFAGDLISIINALELGERGPFGALTASADISRIGLYGHTAGGGAAVEVCLQDERCDAVLGLDPWVEPIPDDVISTEATRPALYMRSDDWQDTENDAVLRGISERSANVTYWVGVEGTNENDFLVTPILSPITSEVGLTGPDRCRANPPHRGPLPARLLRCLPPRDRVGGTGHGQLRRGFGGGDPTLIRRRAPDGCPR